MTKRDLTLVLPQSRRALKPIAREAAIYFAGLFDGEGCVNICERHPRHGGPGQRTPIFKCELSLSNTHHGAMLHVLSVIGGNLFKSTRNPPKKDGHPRRIVWRWGAGPAESIHILHHIVPFLIIKRQQGLLAFEFYKSINELRRQPHPGRLGKLRLSPEEVASRRQFVQKMQALNHPK